MEGAAFGVAKGVQLGDDFGQAVGIGGALGEVIGGTEAAAIILTVDTLFGPLIDAMLLDSDEQTKEYTEKSKQGAPGGKPTHSQLAKDSTEHLNFPASRALAVEAVRIIGSAVREAWNGPEPEESIASVSALVDKIVGYPTTDRWWQPILESP